MKICLINPPVEDFYITGVRRQPLGLLYIASALIEAGHSVNLLNCHSRKNSVMNLPAEFSYLVPYMESSDPAMRFPYKNYCHFGMSWQEIEKRIMETSADMWMISSLFTTYYMETDRIIEIIRRHHKDTLITAGGYHASLYPEYLLRSAGADFVIDGEGEAPAVALANAVSTGGSMDGIPGLVFVNKEEIIRNSKLWISDINTIADPARDLLMDRDFRLYGTRGISMITSRGCPNRCSFCTGKTIWGNTYRVRNPENVLKEIIECSSKYGAEIFNFEDDNLLADRAAGEDFLRCIVEARENGVINCEFTAMNGVSLERVNAETIRLMKRAGFEELNISIVSNSERIQKAEGRPFNSEKFRMAAGEGSKAGMNVRAYFIIGLPGQDNEEIEDTLLFLKSLKVKIFPSVYYNIFSTEKEWKMQRSSAFYNETESLSRNDLFRLFNKCFDA